MSSSDDEDDVPLAIPKLSETVPVHNDAASAARSTPVPVTLVTGFLGAGKSTLIRHILTADHGFRIAVILNEFADDTSIERAIVSDEQGESAVSAEEWVELANGCLCCSVKTEFVAALEGLLRKKSGFDYILIETTGLADPGPVAAALWTDRELEAGVTLDAVVTVADASRLDGQLAAAPAVSAANEAEQQIAHADVVLLNKVDLVDEATLAATEAAIRAVNGSAAIVRTRRCAVDVGRLLNQGAYSGPAGDLLAAANDGLVASLQLDIREDAAQHAGKHEHHGSAPAERPHSPDGGIYEHAAAANAAQPPAAGHDEADGEAQGQGAPSHHGSHLHARRVTSVTLPCQRPLSLDRRIYVPTLQRWVEGLLWDAERSDTANRAAGEVLRMKGLIATADDPRRHVLQAVGPTYEITPGPPWLEGLDRTSRIIVIGADLRRDLLQEQLLSCCS